MFLKEHILYRNYLTCFIMQITEYYIIKLLQLLCIVIELEYNWFIIQCDMQNTVLA